MVQQELSSAFSAITAENGGHPSHLPLKSLDARPQVKPVSDLLPVHEMNARLDLIEVVQTNIAVLRPDRPLNHIQFCYLVGMPLGDLQALAHLPSLLVVDAVHELGKLTAYCNLQADKYFDPSYTGTPSIRSQGSPRTEPDQHRCMVTGLANPQACHIVPFHWNQDQEHVEKTTKLLKTVQTVAFEHRTVNASKTLMEITKDAKSSDMPWNLLCLMPQLYTWWGKAYFGFKYHDATLCKDDPSYSIISLQFVWMPCNVKALATEQVDLAAQRNPLTALGSYLSHRYGQGPLSACTARDCTKCRETLGVKCHDISSNRPIDSGTIVKVRRLTKHRVLFEHVIKLQWSVLCAAAMSGGAQIYDDELLSDSEDYPCGSVPEQQDLEESEEELKEAGENSRQASIEKVESWLQQSESADDMGT
ncbi:hypothetical protein FANTH_6525 [Fusarium anthophilum]|uniref:HNH nuclease domain-containing protein n=1 Tax=Fusarium anthophilum TaxID=48485 RepID=A0A8H4ZIX3_9HYPO|nr:hypothetical protein FANTH_6525 [Fusarium anthophilum]